MRVTQQDLFSEQPEQGDRTLQHEFWQYHRENPKVYQYVCRFAQEAIDKGYGRFAIATIWERIRWEIVIHVRDENFKLPNNHRAYYARLWMKRHPEHADFFRTAVLRSVHPIDRDRYGREMDYSC
jgi:hypothetical protein